MVDSFAHRRALWWYLPLLPLILFPWFWWPPLWKGARALVHEGLERPVRFCLAWLVPGFLTLSLISGKQVHYLLPLFPAVALLAARGFQENETRQLRLRLPAVILVLFGLLVFSLPWWGVLPEWGTELQARWALPMIAAGLLL